jgi:hypothetical protein
MGGMKKFKTKGGAKNAVPKVGFGGVNKHMRDLLNRVDTPSSAAGTAPPPKKKRKKK